MDKYQDFFCSDLALYLQCKQKIEDLLSEETGWKPTPFRYCDKFLWVLGDENRDYSVMDMEKGFREAAGPQLDLIKRKRR